jgi:excisionase family DNA binding protein
MTARPHPTDATPRPRQSVKVATVAAMLECDDSTVRRLVRDGQLQAHRTGKRGIRVYLDGVATYQAAHDVIPLPRNGREIRAKRAQRTRAKTTASMAVLRDLGLVA